MHIINKYEICVKIKNVINKYSQNKMSYINSLGWYSNV